MPKVCPVCDTVYPDANAFCPVDGTTLHVVDLEGGLIGSVVADRYLVTDLLGEGGMGKVYLARHVRLPQQAAIKVLRADMVRDPSAVARFNREASNASRIDDENVARVYDFGEASGGTVYLAMEYVKGSTLRDVIARDGALEPARAASLVDQIAKGLDAAHRLKIIHRDLKPDNILVTEGADGRERVKVVDFGIAKAFGAEDGNLTKTGFVVGTPEFMSPEQLLGSPLDARCDVYALGLVAFQCFTAALPFGGDTPEQMMTGRLTRAPRRLDEVTGKAWPPALQEAFDAALSREVAGRPESAGAFARMVTAAVAGGAAAVSPPPPAPSRPAEGKATVRVASVTPPAAGAPAVPREGGVSRLPAIAALVLVLAVGGYFAFDRFSSTRNAVVATVDEDARVAEERDPAAGNNDADASAKESAGSPGANSTVPAPSVATPPVAATVRPPNETPRSAPPVSAADKKSASPPAEEKAAPAAAPAPVEPSMRSALDSLSAALGRRGVDAAAARQLATALRELAPRISDPSLKARAWFRLIDASVLAGDLTGACAAFRGARTSARGAQLDELRKYDEQLGCS